MPRGGELEGGDVAIRGERHRREGVTDGSFDKLLADCLAA
jgi:hypothetical protein